jgi:hypothetical protein
VGRGPEITIRLNIAPYDISFQSGRSNRSKRFERSGKPADKGGERRTMPHHTIRQISGVRHVTDMRGSPMEHNPHETSHGAEAATEREIKKMYGGKKL